MPAPSWPAAGTEGKKKIMTIRRSSGLLALVVGLVTGAAGCAHADRSGRTALPAPVPTASATDGSGAVPTDGTGVAATASAGAGKPTAPVGAPAPSATKPTRLAALPSQTDSDPSCRPPVLLEATSAALRAATVAQVEVLSCRNGFARLFAVAAQHTEIPGGNQVFLRLDKGVWRVAGRTSAGSDCGDPGLAAEIRAVCAGLV
jgi:hypothetical protein